ncbi:WW domain-containing oxidoreductase [Termitomyces sp. T112]|nr:WW domain-containing oxidoreductase [Termitomyces sp. T112]KAH0589732.1 hypothetical protein H2248_005453 [Termitomyces sp. 'cryptogamus']
MGKLGVAGFLREQLATVPPVEVADLTGKTVMVIGANVGLGFEATRHFARMNPARLILGCRSQSKGKAARKKIQWETGYQAVELWIVDLSKFSSVVAFVDKFEKDGGRLDILLENAAIFPGTYTTTSDGWETALQVNCLSLFLIALRLLPQLIKTSVEHSTRPRLVFVTSEVHFFSNIPKSILQGENIYQALNSNPNVSERYNDSKLLDILFYQALNERLGIQSPLIVNGVNPGFCLSEIRREVSGALRAVTWLMEKLIARTTEEGSRQLVYAAVGGQDNEDQLRGAYISLARVSEASDFAIGAEGHVVQEKLWGEVLGILSKVDPRVEEVAKTYLATCA